VNWFWVLVGIVALGLMVLVHEWGHFVIARLVGVRVEIFSIGFGTRLFGWRRGPTDYRVSVVPLGGYVKMAGDNPTELSGDPGEFFSKPRWQRVLIVLGGPTMNILTAVALLTAVYAVHYERPAVLDEPAVVAAVLPDSPAAAAGVQAGDRILRVNGVAAPTWQDAGLEVALANTEAIALEIQRGGETLPLSLTISESARQRPWEAGWLPDLTPVVRRVQAGSPAAQADLRPGDVLVALADEPIRISPEGHNTVSARLQQLGGQPLALTIEREGKKLELIVTPVFGDHPEGKRWLLGFEYSPDLKMVRKDLTLGQALMVSVRENAELSGRMLDLVGRLFTGRASLRGVQGPVGIVHLTGTEGQRAGWLGVLYLAAAISLSLGVLNLLPIPILDGGHIFIFAVEGALQRDLSLRLKEAFNNVAFVLLILLFAVVMYNDIARIFLN